MYAIALSALGLLVYWLSPGTEVSFGYSKVVSQKGLSWKPETILYTLVLGYQLILHFVRFVAAQGMASEEKVIPRMPEVSSNSLLFVALASLYAHGLFLMLWFAFGAKTQAANYWLPIAFLTVSALSVYAVNFGYVYGYKLAERMRSSIGQDGGAEQSAPRNVARNAKAAVTFKDIFGNADIKRRLLDAARAITAPRKEGKSQRNGILLDGDPGNGKTILAEALAGELGLPFLTMTHSDVASQWVGERTVRIKAAFEQAIRSQPCVFFIDEIDSFIPDRTTSNSSSKEDTDVVNALLTLLVDIRKHKVVVVAATNHMDRLDGAAVREGRFDFKVEITPPDEEARIGLLAFGLKTNAPNVKVAAETIKTVAQRWNGFSVKRILAVTEELPSYLNDMEEKGAKKEALEFEDFMAALRRIQGRFGVSPENVKPLSEMVLPDATKQALNMLAGRLRDPQRVERLGGTLPSGVLFYGPAGTGKTTVCKALAKDVEWAFLVATGPDLARDPKALEKLYAKAKELRPAIIFIDEADDLLRSREYSQYTESTNKLLTLMDGVNDRVNDVVWVAATNHPDQIDPALLRGGRFTEKVEFVRPDESQLAVHIGNWLAQRKIKLADGLDSTEIASMIGDESIANAEGVVQYAVNCAIATATGDEITITASDVHRALIMVLGAAA